MAFFPPYWYKRLINDETHSIGIGPLGFDVEMARGHGWSDDEIERLWKSVSRTYLAASQKMNARHGRTRECPRCECWTYPDAPKPHRCHLCNEDERAARARRL